MADIDNIPLEVSDVPELASYDAGLLWNPEEGAANEDWHTFLRTHLDLAEDYYEVQYDQVVDLFLRAQRQSVLLAALVSRILSTSVSHGLRDGTAKHVDGGLEVSNPYLLDLDLFIREYQKVEGAFEIGETEGFRKWNATPDAQVEEGEDHDRTNTPGS